MSQQKVDKYKKEKANRAKLQKRESRILFLDGGSIACDAPKDEFFGRIRQENDRINKFLSFIGE